MDDLHAAVEETGTGRVQGRGHQTVPDALLAFATQVLGRCVLVANCSWEHRMSSVVSLRDGNRVSWFLKQHNDRERYLAEVTAYRRWVPALGGRAPRLRAFDDSLQAVVLSAVPGELPAWPAAGTDDGDNERRSAEAAIQHDAGTLLRQLHDAEPALLWHEFGSAKVEEFDQLTPFAAGLLTSRELGLARCEVAALAGQPCPVKVPCHRDYTPRNWLVDAGTVYIVDFEWSRLDVWVSDLARLYLGIWTTRPDLRHAFLEGYGRELDTPTMPSCRAVPCSPQSGCWLRHTKPASNHLRTQAEQLSSASLADGNDLSIDGSQIPRCSHCLRHLAPLLPR